MKAAHLGGVVTDLLDVVADLLHNLIVPLLVVLGLSGIHLVEGHNDLPYTQGVGQQGMLARLAILADASLKTTRSRIDDEHSAVSLAGACRAMSEGVGDMQTKCDVFPCQMSTQWGTAGKIPACDQPLAGHTLQLM